MAEKPNYLAELAERLRTQSHIVPLGGRDQRLEFALPTGKDAEAMIEELSDADASPSAQIAAARRHFAAALRQHGTKPTEEHAKVIAAAAPVADVMRVVTSLSGLEDHVPT